MIPNLVVVEGVSVGSPWVQNSTMVTVGKVTCRREIYASRGFKSIAISGVSQVLTYMHTFSEAIDWCTTLRYSLSERAAMANHPKSPAKNPTGDFGQFTNFMQRLVAVPHSEIKPKLDAEKRAKTRKRKAASRASREND